MDPDNLNTENPGGGLLCSDSTPCHGTPYNAFHQILASSRDQMLRYGRQVTMDTLQMTVHRFHFPYVAEEGGKTLSTTRCLLVMPNPTTGGIKVRYRLEKPGPVRLRVFSSDGRAVDAIAFRANSAGERTLGIVRNLTAGTYLLFLETPDGRLSQRIVVPSR
jgi:hypothetical protein